MWSEAYKLSQILLVDKDNQGGSGGCRGLHKFPWKIFFETAQTASLLTSRHVIQHELHIVNYTGTFSTGETSYIGWKLLPSGGSNLVRGFLML